MTHLSYFAGLLGVSDGITREQDPSLPPSREVWNLPPPPPLIWRSLFLLHPVPANPPPGRRHKFLKLFITRRLTLENCDTQRRPAAAHRDTHPLAPAISNSLPFPIHPSLPHVCMFTFSFLKYSRFYLKTKFYFI